MKRLTCEMCGSTELLKENGVFVCQSCGCQYSVEEAKKLMIEGTVEVQGTVKVDKREEADTLLKRAFMFLEDGDFDHATEYCNKVLDIDPENVRAYLGKLMAELTITNENDQNRAWLTEDNINYQKVLKFGSPDLQTKVKTWLESRSPLIIKDNCLIEHDIRARGCYHHIEVPDGVTSIAASAFFYCYDLTSITIPDSVTSIGDNAFNHCSGLTSITIPDSVTSIGQYAFKECTCLTSITIPNSVTSIGQYAFEDCKKLTSVYITDIVAWSNISFGSYTSNPLYEGCAKLYLNGALVSNLIIPDDVTSIEKYAFCNCSSLYSITIPGSITKINQSTFFGCKNLTSIAIPNSVTSIEKSAFCNCSSLTSITIPDSVTSIGDYAFHGCSSLTAITIPDSVTSIGQYAFSNCISLSSITIPSSITKINGSTFSECKNLTSITIPNSVTNIDRFAFNDCTSLTSITIPDQVTHIENNAFSNCTNLSSIKLPAGCLGRFQLMFDHNPPSSLKVIITGGGSKICDRAFSGCKYLTSVTIPDGITSIEGSAFMNCTGLTSVRVPNSVTFIGDFAFSNCTSLTFIDVPNKSAKISPNAFMGCSKLAHCPYNGNINSANTSSTSGSTNVSGSASTSGGCYIATCVYGSYDCPEVWTLRRYRDNALGTTWYGRLFIRAYYAISPTLVRRFGHTKWFQRFWKGKLDRMINKLQSNGVESTPYQDKIW